jgi:hypothetical protein
MKLKILKLTLEQFTMLLQGKASPFADNLPDDIEVFDSKVDLFAKQVTLILRSNKFQDVPESFPIPEMTASRITQTQSIAAKSSPSVLRIEPKIEASSTERKTLTINSTQPPISRYAAKMENEFTPDQRKLLSFTVRDDCVVVKPVTFLKAEWDDINEVVRSLGGRWVKGDIISYWEIPL